jgi:hypothetical protein
MDEETIDDVRDNVDMILLQDAITEQLNTLLPREELVLRHRFWGELTLDQTGEIIGVTRERVRQIQAKGLRKLRHMSRYPGWEKLGRPHINDFIKQRDAEQLAERQQQFDESERAYREYKARRNEILSRQRPIQHPTCFLDKIAPHENEPEIVPKPVVGRASVYCPQIVTLQFSHDGSPYLDARYHNGDYHASIDRARDPETYDRWLAQRIEEHKRAQ